jgi:hypothetical protein
MVPPVGYESVPSKRRFGGSNDAASRDIPAPSEFRPHSVTLRTSVALAATCAVVLATLACGKQTVVVWQKPGAAPGELEAAREACLAEMNAEPVSTVNRSRLEAEVSGACFVACMRRKGWTWRTEQVGSGDEGATPAQAAPQEPVVAPPASCPVPADDGGVDGSEVGRGGE